MPEWILLALAVAVASAAVTLSAVRLFAGARLRRAAGPLSEPASPAQAPSASENGSSGAHEQAAQTARLHVATGFGPSSGRRRILVVDDDAALRLLLRTTLSADEYELEEASGAVEAATLTRFRRPSVAILDVGLPDGDGLSLCRQLKRSPDAPVVILLTGADTSEADASSCGADALLRKPFSPLELLGLLDRVIAGGGMRLAEPPKGDADQLLLYARDVNRLLEIERTQRRLLQQAYRETTSALADALEAKDRRTGIHALRVQAYALEIAEATDLTLLDDPSLEHGFLLHDIGKIAIPDPILNKPGPLDASETETIRQHPMIGVEILQDVALLQGEGLGVVRSHHERWDGGGYPDALAGQEIPLGARIFAVADTLDAMTTDRPYRDAVSWDDAIDEIMSQNGRQFDPRVVNAFARREPRLRRLYNEFATVAA